MKYLVDIFFFIIGVILRIIGAFFIALWHFHYNPILERGTRNGYFYKPWDYTLYDWLFYGNKPQYRGVR